MTTQIIIRSGGHDVQINIYDRLKTGGAWELTSSTIKRPTELAPVLYCTTTRMIQVVDLEPGPVVPPDLEPGRQPDAHPGPYPDEQATGGPVNLPDMAPGIPGQNED